MKYIFTVLVLLGTIHPAFSQGKNSTDPDSPAFRTPSEYAAYFVRNDSLDFQTDRFHNFEIYYKEDTYASEHLGFLKEEVEKAYERVLTVLSEENYPYGIRYVIVGSEEEMERLMGYHIKGGAAPGHDLIFFVFNEEIRPQLKHEMFHLMAYELWGPYKNRLLDEGGAIYTDNQCFYENPLTQINAYMYSHDLLMDMNALINDFNGQAAENDIIAYLQSGAIFRYLYEEYGIEKLKQLWTKGFTEFEDIYGMSLPKFREEWMLQVSQFEMTDQVDWELIMNQGCG